jgi:putative membrane protein
MGVGGWVAMGIFWVAVIALSVWGLATLFPRETGSRDPRTVLKGRLAAGEISLQEYKKISAELEPPTAPSPER